MGVGDPHTHHLAGYLYTVATQVFVVRIVKLFLELQEPEEIRENLKLFKPAAKNGDRCWMIPVT